ncbi:MAG TPA: VOC family protein [Actinomycetota bacterium]|nr:VOC family protein [Actinomycetota bacterium]
MPDARFLFITLDCVDPAVVADFWSALLGTPVEASMDDGRFVFIAAGEGLPTICFQRVPEAKVVKNRMHLDLAVDDLAAATARIEELGGSWPGAEHTLEQFRWRTVLDPEGNEFDIALTDE